MKTVKAKETSRRPLCEGRGLKYIEAQNDLRTLWSSPVRGTWIEICPVRSISPAGKSSPVRGGRGLKCNGNAHLLKIYQVVPRAGDVDSGSKTNAAV